MHTIPHAVVPVIAAETRAILTATDQALLAHAQLLAAVVQGASVSDLPISVTQDIYAQISAHGGRLVESRGELRRLIAKLTTVHENSNQREVATGCPAGLPKHADAVFFTGASLTEQPA